MRGQLKYSNTEIINGIRNKDNAVLQYIIKINYKPVKQLVLKNSGCESDVNDVLQEAIIVLFRKTSNNNFKLTSSINTFIYSIATLIWLKELELRRMSMIDGDYDTIDESDNIQDTIEKSERLRLYRDKFEELGKDCKKVLRLFYLGTPIPQITKFMKYNSDEYTKKRKYQCKDALINKIHNSKQYKELGNENN